MKKIILCLLLGISLLKAECSVLGFELGVTTLKEIGKKTKLEIIDKNTARISPELFGIEGLEDVELRYRGEKVYQIGLLFEPSQKKYWELKKVLKSKYHLYAESEEKIGAGLAGDVTFFAKDNKNCLVWLNVVEIENKGEGILFIYYALVNAITPEEKYL
ncbi:hypothetical protein B6S12_05065 [Helicobacter valdiviensis]|uniref:Lipoprotein n=1 Tax=Helicobacter valdiviensis TaxID=1458358 RepID=A0A2W6MV09_9HELI|nr:hypothetical protein [Helicobacter valdiviensis]PZT48192.1 hypothetical protein B6S12_05065 [Helicobacter valdiviensis]